MIIGIGIDIVSNKRFSKWLFAPRIIDRFFHEKEAEAAKHAQTITGGSVKNGSFAVQSRVCEMLAVRFAAKEAFGKALGTGLNGISLKNICVDNDENGKPELELYGDALAAFKRSGASSVHVSLSHETDYSIAFVVLEA